MHEKQADRDLSRDESEFFADFLYYRGVDYAVKSPSDVEKKHGYMDYKEFREKLLSEIKQYEFVMDEPTKVYFEALQTGAMIKKESAGGVIMNEFGELVLVFTDTQSWQFPKGGVEEGEEILSTALREIEEECGLKELTLVKKLPIYTRISRDKSTSRDIHYFLFRASKKKLIPQAEVTACEWVPLAEVEAKLTYDEDKAFFREILPTLDQE